MINTNNKNSHSHEHCHHQGYVFFYVLNNPTRGKNIVLDFDKSIRLLLSHPLPFQRRAFGSLQSLILFLLFFPTDVHDKSHDSCGLGWVTTVGRCTNCDSVSIISINDYHLIIAHKTSRIHDTILNSHLKNSSSSQICALLILINSQGDILVNNSSTWRMLIRYHHRRHSDRSIWQTRILIHRILFLHDNVTISSVSFTTSLIISKTDTLKFFVGVPIS